MNTKYTTITIIFAFLFLPVFTQIYAESPNRSLRQQIKKEVIEEKKENLIEKAKNLIKEKIRNQINGKLTAIEGKSLTVQKDKKTFTVNTSDTTQFKRKFGGTSSLNELSLNDQLLIIGNRKKNSDGSHSTTEIEASYIRNMSIQRRFAVFTGEVTAKTDTTLTLKTQGRGIQTVYISTNTKYAEKNKAISYASITIGDKILVKGELWDRATAKIDATSILRLVSRQIVIPSPTL